MFLAMAWERHRHRECVSVIKREKTNIFPLDAWRGKSQYHPWHFWGLADDSLLKLTSACNHVLPEYSWQKADMISRESVREAIQTAESRLREHLNFSIGRRFVEETYSVPRPAHYGAQFASHAGADGRWLNLRLHEGFIRNIGVETYSAVSTAVAVTLSDEDGDGISETFTITAGTSATDPDQLGVYFQASDRLDGDPVSERYRIAPVKVTIAGGTATIKGKAWMLIRPIKREGVAAVTGQNPATAGVLATAVDIYRRYADPTGTTNDTAQALLIWETEAFPMWASGCNGGGLTFADGSRDPAAVAYAVARAGIRDGRLGEVYVGQATYDATTGSWTAQDWGNCRQPDRVVIRYEAGVELNALESTSHLGRLSGDWDNIIFRLSCAEMPRRAWACDDANQAIYRWQFDMARSAGANDEQYRIGEKDLNCPWGTAAGAIYAWNQVKHLFTVQAVLLG